MLKVLSAGGLALLMTVGGVVTSAPSVKAQELGIEIGPDGLQLRDRDRDRRHRDRDFDPDRDENRRRGCDPEEARQIARESGLRRARIVRADGRRIVIEGMTRQGPDRMIFANRRGCPEL